MKKINNGHIAKLIEESLSLKQIGSLTKAEYGLRKVLKIEPNNFIALNNLGNICSAKNDLKKAKFFFTKAIGVKKNYSNEYVWKRR